VSHIKSLKIVEAQELENFESRINNLIKLGYELSGNMIVSITSTGIKNYYQRMVLLKSELLNEEQSL